MRKFLALLLALLMLLAVATPVLAIADPDTPPAVNAVYVYEFDDGSIGVLVEYFLDYAAPPTETAAQAFLVVFIDTDGTQLKSVAPYVFQNGGYDGGVVWIKFTASEVSAYSLDSADQADYRVWLVGNPTLAWASDPPKTVATIDEWNTTGAMSTLLALRVLYYADIFELDWGGSYDLIESTASGNKLTTLGESYFVNAIPDLRNLAPSCFGSYTQSPNIENIDYSTSFGATLTNGTGVATGSPITLAEGANNVDVTTLGTFTVTLNQGTQGTAESDVATVTGSPAALVAGTNTITTTGVIGNIVVTVNLVNTTTVKEDEIIGTGWDLTDLGAAFGMSRWMISGIVWIILSVIICAASLGTFRKQEMFDQEASTKVVMIIFDNCIVIGILLGLLAPLVGVLMFIGFGTLTGYVLFFRGANL